MGEIKSVIVTGAGGHQGGAVARCLLQEGRFHVRALMHHAETPEAAELARLGAEIIEADFDLPMTLHDAMAGMDAVFSVQDFRHVGYLGEVNQGKNVVLAAKEAEVKHFVYSSVGSANKRTGIPHFDSKAAVENYIRDMALPYTILRPVFFYYNYFSSLLSGQLEKGVLRQPLQHDTKLQQLCEDDYARLVARVLSEPKDFIGKDFDVAGVELSMSETVEELSQGLGFSIRYEQLSWESFHRQTGEEMTLMYRWFERSGYDADLAYIGELMGWTTPLRNYMRNHPARHEIAG